MFKKLFNEAVITYKLRTDGPILINSGEGSKIDPTLPDMRFVRIQRGNESVVYLPGSSIKGVFRSRYEQLGKVIELDGKTVPVCDPFSKYRNSNCHEAIRSIRPSLPPDGALRYRKSCFACRMFGSLSLAGRVRFTDAYPEGEVKYGMRNGVGIDRITGAANGGKLFSFEVVEEGVFSGRIHLTNFKLYQLFTILWILKDIDDGLVTFGMGGTRGNGKMKLDCDCQMKLREYDTSKLLSINNQAGVQEKSPFGGAISYNNAINLIDQITVDQLAREVHNEGWTECYVR